MISLGIPLWKLGTAVGLILALVGSCALRDKQIEQRGAQKVVAASKEQSKINAAKSQKAHEKARKPGAAERLLRDSCRDC